MTSVGNSQYGSGNSHNGTKYENGFGKKDCNVNYNFTDNRNENEHHHNYIIDMNEQQNSYSEQINIVSIYDNHKQPALMVSPISSSSSKRTKHHPTTLDPSKFKTTLCANFMAGKCTFNQDCHFAHGQQEMRNNFNGKAPAEMMWRSQLCRDWTKQKCPWGAKCRFAHGEQMLNTMVLFDTVHTSPIFNNKTASSHHNQTNLGASFYNDNVTTGLPNSQDTTLSLQNKNAEIERLTTENMFLKKKIECYEDYIKKCNCGAANVHNINNIDQNNGNKHLESHSINNHNKNLKLKSKSPTNSRSRSRSRSRVSYSK